MQFARNWKTSAVKESFIGWKSLACSLPVALSSLRNVKDVRAICFTIKNNELAGSSYSELCRSSASSRSSLRRSLSEKAKEGKRQNVFIIIFTSLAIPQLAHRAVEHERLQWSDKIIIIHNLMTRWQNPRRARVTEWKAESSRNPSVQINKYLCNSCLVSREALVMVTSVCSIKSLGCRPFPEPFRVLIATDEEFKYKNTSNTLSLNALDVNVQFEAWQTQQVAFHYIQHSLCGRLCYSPPQQAFTSDWLSALHPKSDRNGNKTMRKRERTFWDDFSSDKM